MLSPSSSVNDSSLLKLARTAGVPFLAAALGFARGGSSASDPSSDLPRFLKLNSETQLILPNLYRRRPDEGLADGGFGPTLLDGSKAPRGHPDPPPT